MIHDNRNTREPIAVCQTNSGSRAAFRYATLMGRTGGRDVYHLDGRAVLARLEALREQLVLLQAALQHRIVGVCELGHEVLGLAVDRFCVGADGLERNEREGAVPRVPLVVAIVDIVLDLWRGRSTWNIAEMSER